MLFFRATKVFIDILGDENNQEYQGGGEDTIKLLSQFLAKCLRENGFYVMKEKDDDTDMSLSDLIQIVDNIFVQAEQEQKNSPSNTTYAISLEKLKDKKQNPFIACFISVDTDDEAEEPEVMIKESTLNSIKANPESSFNVWLEQAKKNFNEFFKSEFFEQPSNEVQAEISNIGEVVKSAVDNQKLSFFSAKGNNSQAIAGFLADLVISAKGDEKAFENKCQSLGIFSVKTGCGDSKITFIPSKPLRLDELPESVSEVLENRIAVVKKIERAVNEFAKTMSNLCGGEEAKTEENVKDQIQELLKYIDKGAVYEAKKKIDEISSSVEQQEKVFNQTEL